MAMFWKKTCVNVFYKYWRGKKNQPLGIWDREPCVSEIA